MFAPSNVTFWILYYNLMPFTDYTNWFPPFQGIYTYATRDYAQVIYNIQYTALQEDYVIKIIEMAVKMYETNKFDHPVYIYI